MTNPTCPKCDSVAGCQSRERLCPNLQARSNLQELIADLRMNHEYCGKEVILQAADELEKLAIAQPEQPIQEPVAFARSDTVFGLRGQVINAAMMFPSPVGLENPIGLYTGPIAQPEQTSPRGTDAQILKERELTASAIVGAMAYGFQNGEYPPDDSAWLRPFWTMGRRDAEREVAIAQPEQPCQGCNGNGEVGGLRFDGYHSEICPFCKGDGTEKIAQPKDKP